MEYVTLETCTEREAKNDQAKYCVFLLVCVLPRSGLIIQ